MDKSTSSLPDAFYKKACSYKSLKIHKKTHLLESLFNKVAGPQTFNFHCRCKFTCEFFKNTFFTEHVRKTAFVDLPISGVKLKVQFFLVSHSLKKKIIEEEGLHIRVKLRSWCLKHAFCLIKQQNCWKVGWTNLIKLFKVKPYAMKIIFQNLWILIQQIEMIFLIYYYCISSNKRTHPTVFT